MSDKRLPNCPRVTPGSHPLVLSEGGWCHLACPSCPGWDFDSNLSRYRKERNLGSPHQSIEIFQPGAEQVVHGLAIPFPLTG